MTEVETPFVKYVFLDVVSFTNRRSVEAQSDIVKQLNAIVRQAIKEIGIEGNDIIFLPTGDGMCICMLYVDHPYDVHMLHALAILRGVQSWNENTKDSMRKFSVRIGVNANYDNIVEDINGKRNLAGSGINMAQRVMNAGEGNQIMVGVAVHDTLQQREKYMKTFRKYQAKIKHGTLEVFQFIEGGHVGLNTDIPAQFQPRQIGEAKLTVWAAYYLAHALNLQDVISKHTNNSGAADTWAVMLWLLAADSAVIKGQRPFESRSTRFWKSPSGNILDSSIITMLRIGSLWNE